MSHKKLRTDKQCLNCGHTVEDRYCSLCGQENLELDDSAFHLVIHYIQDLFHYDGKLWNTLRSLLTRPGLVAHEYMEGKRKKHLEPIRFYVFASTVFFITFFFVLGEDNYESGLTPETNYTKRLYNLKQEKSFLKGSPDTAYVNPLILSLLRKSLDTVASGQDTSVGDLEIELFDASLDTLEGDGWLVRILQKRIEERTAELEEEHEGDEVKATGALINEVIHTLPQLFFLSLPFFALFLKLLYWRGRRSSYVEHFIFSIYHYAYLFVIMLFYILAGWLMNNAEGAFMEQFADWFTVILVLYPIVYLFLSMKRFYNDRWWSLLVRYVLLSFLFVALILALFLLLAIITFLW